MALNDVSFNLRDNEFVAILGHSGSGKTTMLNLIGGLDRYDSGDIIINGVSTKKYKDSDWDSYRNHTVGFVFQSYNLIPHQSVLSNVELALTISGISKTERKIRAKEALTQVGLGDQIYKKPNQMSGGQMQRVAIARALVNDPDILLADEPTGALDSDTSVQVMELLKEVAKDRLVVMVTHNSELATQYATRIIRLHDGKMLDDSDKYEVDESKLAPPKHNNMGKASMSFATALALSFNNLRTKKARTLLTAFAGSIGIIGIALILSLSTGVNQYIADMQKDTMTSYPISIEARAMDLSSLMSLGQNSARDGDVSHELEGVYSNPIDMELASTAMTSIKENNLTKFKEYLDDPASKIHDYVGENGIVYTYDVKFSTYSYDPNGEIINTDGSDFAEGSSLYGMSSMADMSSMFGMSGMSSDIFSNNFQELLAGTSGNVISSTVRDSYELLSGQWPQAYNEAVLILDQNNEITSSVLYELGLMPAGEYKEILKKLEKNEEVTLSSYEWTYEEVMNHSFYIVPACDFYVEGEDGLFQYIAGDKTKLENLIANAIEMNISGIIRPNADAAYSSLTGAVGYTRLLTDYLIGYTNNSAVVKAQENDPDYNILYGVAFEPKDDNAKVEDMIGYLTSLGVTEKAAFAKNMTQAMYAADPESLAAASAMSETELAQTLDYYLLDPDNDMLIMLYDSYISTGSYEDNLSAFGVVSLDAPSSISIYTDSFENKDYVSDYIEQYNASVSTEYQITFTDYVGLLMSSITTIINVISYVLIAFVAVSLIVSSIMLGIITFISVLERTKEIGILRAIGASKRNISQVFNAETFIVGLISGFMGIVITLLLLIPGNFIIHAVSGVSNINAVLHLDHAALLVLLSVVLTLIAGLLPSRKAAKKDPVVALRTE